AILLDTDESGAMYVAERIRKSLESHVFKAYDLELKMTTSIGFATYSSRIKEPGEIVEWADSALYQAKRQGKNRVCAYINR
ncbi:MAG: diguanylate cyclase (GGDEF)-like protein, partial [Candidatus Omnitrophota bacterium]